MLTPDQITALAPDAASLKAGRGLATGRKWESAGGDAEVLWGLAMGSGKEPYQTRVSLTDFATKCSCPSRKFPCKHALGLMFLATGEPASLMQKERPQWVTEWLDARTSRQEKAAVRAEEKASKPVDEKAAEKRRVQREGRIDEGVALLQQAILDLTREGLASSAARDASAWENLARRMIDAQAPGLAGAARHVADTVLRDASVDEELPFELGLLYLLLHAAGNRESLDEVTRTEIDAQLGARSDESTRLPVEDEWFVAARHVEERDRLITSASWLFGKQSRRWARVLRFAPVPQTVVEPWPVGTTVKAVLQFHPGLFPLRATPDGDGLATLQRIDDISDAGLEDLLSRFASTLAANPFVRALPFLIKLRPQDRLLVDENGGALPWLATDDHALRIECIGGGHAVLMAGEWDGRHLAVSSIADGPAWIPLTSQQP